MTLFNLASYMRGVVYNEIAALEAASTPAEPDPEDPET
jgi:hypothetical protein